MFNGISNTLQDFNYPSKYIWITSNLFQYALTIDQ